ncbi:MAG: DUF1553 domain-containing protein [Agriterribacter sp.]
MKKFFSNRIVWTAIVLIAAVIVFAFNTQKHVIDYSADVKPILNKRCITCHGGVKKQGGFSLLFREEALGKTESGHPAIIPGDPDKSEMIKRLTMHDPEERMPYKKEPLSENEIDILRRWIKQGAQWGEHWAYVPVKQPAVPKPHTFFGLISKDNEWAKNEIDYFVADKQDEMNMTHATEADKRTLFRRVSLDLIGMPAKDEWLQQYLSDKTGKGYETLVDSLLGSSHYGERWTSMWLDMARYADTKGYEADQSREIWKYRDWLINAFNSDKPYNEFLTEQIAGDLLPNPTDAQYIATAFHRNSMTNDEGGTDNEEFRTAAVVDRVNTTWEVLMGTTFACVQCHSHPYDPFKHDEYYKFLAFFNNSRDEDTQADYPLLRQFKGGDSSKLIALNKWLHQNTDAVKANHIYSFEKTWQPAINALQCDKFQNAALASSWYAAMRNNGSCRLPNVHLSHKKRVLYRYTSGYNGGVWTIRLDSLNGTVLNKTVLKKTEGWDIATFDFNETAGIHDLYFTYTNPALQNKENTGVMFDWFQFDESFPGKDKPGYDSAYNTYWQLLRAPAETTPVMVESNDEQYRTTRVFERGNWLVKGDEVNPATPHVLNPMPAGAPANRLGLAMWLTDKKNPLTARTMVNRLWEQLFGNGIAETLEDLGSQGIQPTHQQLLDWMAWKFMNDDGWSLKKTLKRMVMSATYMQASFANKDILEKDPYNKYFTRGPRVRLSAEQIRDQALVISGIMSSKMFGPSIMPYQPKGLWLSPWNGADWEQSKGEDQHRRGVYIYWKRTAPYPSMITFDATGREVCSSRRIRTNTPLQALVTLNDEAYLEAARYFAVRMQKEGGRNIKDQIKKGYTLATYQNISNEGLAVLEKLYQTSLNTYKKDPAAACDMLDNSMGDQKTAPETAALTVVASGILNMDEIITKN